MSDLPTRPLRRRTGRLVLAAVAAAVLLTSTAAGDPASAQDRPAGASWLPGTPPGWPQVVDFSRTPSETVTRGVTHYSETYDTVGGRQHTQVLNVNLSDPNVRLGVVQAGDTITDPADETVSSMAARTHAVAGVNGDYFEIHGTGRPIGGVISDGVLMKTPVPGFDSQLGVRPDGSLVMGSETFSGSVTDGAASHPLASVNTVNDLAAGAITEVTPYLGASTGLTSGTLVLGHTASAGSFTVDSVTTSVTAIARLASGQAGLMGGGAGGRWLAANVRRGDTVRVATALAPDDDLTQLISGVTTLVKNGQFYQDPTGKPPSGPNPETAIGISRDGEHATVVTLDGRAGTATAFGVTPAQVAGYLVAHGAYTAELFDGGGSTEMVTRKPGDTQVSVANTPSSPGGAERPVGNGVFVYTTAGHAGPPVHLTVGDGGRVTTLTGGAVPMPVHATDRLGNPATGTPAVRVVPAGLATWSNGRLTAHRPGDGRIVATDGRVTVSQPLRVVADLARLTISPTAADVAAGATQRFTLAGATGSGAAVDIPAEAARFRVGQPSLGTVDADGLFTADAHNSGMAEVTATVAGATATADVAVGDLTKSLDPMNATGAWSLSGNTTARGATLAADPAAAPPGSGAPGALRLDYTLPAGSGAGQLVISPHGAPRTTTHDGRDPDGVGLWVKGDGVELEQSYLGVDGVRAPLYPTGAIRNGWRFAVAQPPPGLTFPLTVDSVDFAALSPSRTTRGSLEVGGLSALYAPRPPSLPRYTSVPKNPAWLGREESADGFGPGGETLLTGGGARLTAADPGSSGAAVMRAVADRLRSLTPRARPEQAQLLGDMTADGDSADLLAAHSAADGLGVPARDAVGAGETSQGTDPENGGFASVFGDTHYAYTAGSARVIVTDSAHGGLQSSDPYQDPAGSQYPWLVSELTDTTARAVIVATSLPGYDPRDPGTSRFSDPWEARMYLRLVQKYQLSHRDRHVVMVSDAAGGFAEQMLDPTGESAGAGQGGIPQFTFGGLVAPAELPTAQGGFADFGLLHVTPGGDVRFTVEPVLSAIRVDAPDTTPAAGATEALSATGDEVGGGAEATVPIADPAAHVWSSTDPAVASVDPVTGVVTAHRAGAATVSVTSGGVTGSVPLTVN